MNESMWQRETCGTGRKYILGSDPYVKYDDQEAIISTIVKGLKEFIHAKPAIRLTLDSELCNPERVILAIPFELDQESILNNFANIIYQSLMGYYFSAENQTSHFGIANLLIEGNFNSLLKREMEKLIRHSENRYDMAGRLLQNTEMVTKFPVPEAGKTYLSETIKKGMDIHVGYRIYASGANVNYAKIFLPLESGSEIIDYVYYNLEQILHHNFVSYDETGDKYLSLTETLIFKELEGILIRAKSKEFTRNKILNNLQLNTVLLREPALDQEYPCKDEIYDLLNHIQDPKLKKASFHSRGMYTAFMQETSNIIQNISEEGSEDKKSSMRAGRNQITSARTGLGLSQRTDQNGSVNGSQRTASPQARSEASPAARRTESRQRPRVQVPAPPEENLRVPPPRQKFVLDR